MSVTLGIDLGTTNSVVAVPFGDAIEVIENENSRRRTPSVVSFDPDGVYVGQSAVNRSSKYPNDTIHSIKRQIGEDDYEYSAPDGNDYSPVDISALILRKLKQDAERVLDEEVTEAVITVPAYFGNNEREAVKNAGSIAGLDVERVINEPTAACIAYGYRGGGDQTVLMYDLGGGTFDATLVEASGTLIEVQATDGDSLLGGEDWDGRILDILIEQIERETDWNPESDPATMQRLWDAAQETKHCLSEKQKTTVQLPFLTELHGESYSLEVEVTREEFERRTEDLLNRTLDITDRLLSEAGVSPSALDDVVLVGGSTRMAQVRETIADYVGQKPNLSVDPDMAVAIGAAKQAGTIGGRKLPPEDEEVTAGLTRIDSDDQDDVLLFDVTSHTLGTEAIIDGRSGRFSELIQRNTQIPERVTKTYHTVHDGQEQVVVGVYQGESALAAENEFLGEFELSGIPPAPAGEMEIEITFEVDENGILNVSARNPAGGIDDQITIESGIGLTEAQRDRRRRQLPPIK